MMSGPSGKLTSRNPASAAPAIRVTAASSVSPVRRQIVPNAASMMITPPADSPLKPSMMLTEWAMPAMANAVNGTATHGAASA